MNQRFKALGAIFIFAGIILFGFQNCSEILGESQVQTLQSTCSQNPVNQSKMLISPSTLHDPNLKSSLSLLIHPRCLLTQEEELHFFDQALELTEAQKELSSVALPLWEESPIDSELLEKELAKSECFLGLTSDPLLTSSQISKSTPLTDDPEVINQRHLNFTEYQKSSNETQKEKVVIAIIDTGVDYEHTDLKARMWQNARGEHGFNFVDNNNDPMDDDGHGTHIAGLIAAEENNGFGVAGLTGDFVEIMAIKSLPSRQAGRTSDIYNGIEYAINNGADIISLSIYAEGLNPLLESAIIKAIQHNIIVVLAIGNQSKKLSSNDPVAPAYIGAALNGAVTVASVDTVSGELSFFSNYGDKFAEVAAPGAENGGLRDQGLLSTLPGENWGRLRGTSQAAPIVSAMAATWISFLRSNNISYTPEMLEKLLLAKGTRSFEALSEKITQGRVINFKVMSENLEKNKVLSFFKSQKQEGLCSTTPLN